MADFSSGGMDWMDALAPTETYGENGFSSPSSFSNLSGLEGLFSSAGYQGNGSNSGLMTGGGENSEAEIDPNVLNWLKQNNFTLGTTGGAGGLDYSLANIFNGNNQAVGQQVGWNNSAGPLWDAATAIATGAATGGLGAGLGLTGAAAGAASGAAGGALNAGMQGGNIFKGALGGAVGGGLSGAASGSSAITGNNPSAFVPAQGASFNPASSLGIDNKFLGGVVNRGIGSAGSALAQGGNPLQAALKGGLSAGINGGINYGANQLSNFANSPSDVGGNQNMDFFDGTTGDSSGFDGTSGSQPDLQSIMGNFLGQSRMPQEQMNVMNSPSLSKAINPNMSLGVDFNPYLGSENNQQTASNPIKEMLQGVMSVGSNFGPTPGQGVGNLVGGLAGLYSGYQQRKRSGQLAGQLNDMFSPNSPYAQQLRQQLVRKDAAAGRRSQYGPREVELQARLAEMNSRNTPLLANLYGSQNAGTERMLSNGIRMAQQGHLFDRLGNYMSGLSSDYALGPNAGPQPEYGY